MKKSKSIIAFFLLCAMLAGCGEKGTRESGLADTDVKGNEVLREGEPETSGDMAQEESNVISEFKNGDRISAQLTEDVTLDAVIQFPEDRMGEVEKFRVGISDYEGKNLSEKFGISLEKFEKQELGRGTSYFYEGALPVGDMQMDGSLQFDSEFRLATDHWYDKCAHNFPIVGNNNGWEGKDGVSLDADFSFQTKEEAMEAGKEYLKEMIGVEVSPLEILAIDHKDMEAFQKEDYNNSNSGSGKPMEKQIDQWDESDDCYWIFYEQFFQGVPLLSNTVSRQDEVLVPDNRIELGYTASGVEYAYVRANYEILESEKAALLPLTEICNSLERKFEMMFTGEMTIDEMKLIYYPFPVETADGWFDYELVPVWQFGFGKEARSYIYINALDGVEITG